MTVIQKFIASSLTFLSFAVTDCNSQGLVYRTGCCPEPEKIPDVAKRTTDFVEKYGFGAETHEIVTEDGYIISAHRVIPKTGKKQGRPAVIAQHGISSSSTIWVMSQEKSFPFLLTEAGFDVWLLNTRGNSYSRKHLYLSTLDPRFWKFSFHEQGIFDLAAAVDYVLAVTGNEKVFYVGHSRGTTMAFALLSTRPEYNSKFHLLSLLAPVAYVKNIGNPLLKLSFSSPGLYNLPEVIQSLGAYIVPGSSEFAIQSREIVCNRTQAVCIDLIFSFSGYDYELLNRSMIPVYLAHYPEGGAVQEFVHYFQIGITDKFRQFDYGREINEMLYKSWTPPFYDFSRITAPISLHYSDNDLFVRPKDLAHLKSQLTSVVAKIRVPFKKFTHMDFMWATKADEYVYKPTIDLMKQFLPRTYHPLQ